MQSECSEHKENKLFGCVSQFSTDQKQNASHVLILHTAIVLDITQQVQQLKRALFPSSHWTSEIMFSVYGV